MSKEKMNVTATEQKKATIEVIQHATFDGDMKTNITSSIEMADVVSSLFAPAFADYYGCKIRINDGLALPEVANSLPSGALYVDLYFKDRGDVAEGSNAYKNIIARGSKAAGTDLGSRFMAVNGAGNGRVYEVTKETYEMLEEFMPRTKTRWAAHTQEMASQMTVYGKEEVVVCISGLDLNKVITKIYGAKTKEGRYEYIATPSTIIPTKSQEFIMQVVQLDLSAVRDLQNKLGIYGANTPQFHPYNG